jgi:hypothetical protein
VLTSIDILRRDGHSRINASAVGQLWVEAGPNATARGLATRQNSQAPFTRVYLVTQGLSMNFGRVGSYIDRS